MQQRSIDYDALKARLRDRLGPEAVAQLEEGQRAADYLRPSLPTSADDYVRPDQVRPNPSVIPLKPPEKQYGKAIKIWPNVLLAAIKAKTAGAARLYFLARSLDQTGCGMVFAGDLHSLLRDLKVQRRTRERWQRQAFQLGILRPVRSRGLPMIRIIGLWRAAVALGCDRVGLPATMGNAALTGKGWRAWLWAAYLTTTKGRPISQAVKADLTGIDERTQRNYQAAIPGEKIKNTRRVYLSGSRSDRQRQAEGLAEVQGMTIFTDKQGRTWQALPDGRKVPDFVSRLGKKGASRKHQRQLNHQNNPSSIPGRRSCDGVGVRLFCETDKQVQSAIRNTRDLAPWDRPSEVFQLSKVITPRRGPIQLNQWCAHAI